MEGMGKQMGEWKDQIKRKWDKKGGNKPPGKNSEAWRVPQEKDNTPWWEHHSHNHSIASGFKAKRQELESQLKSLMSDCTADKSKSDECHSNNKTLKGESLKKFWESNPKANMLRWEHKTEEFINTVEGMSKKLAKSDARLSYLRDKLAPLITQASPNTSTARKIQTLRRAVSMMEARQRLIDQYNTFKSQKSAWDTSPIAKCLESRKAKFADSLMPGLLQTEPESIARHNTDMESVWDECEKIANKSLPFAKGGCFDKLAENFNGLSAKFGKLWNPAKEGTKWDSFLNTLESSIGTIENECVNGREKNQTCQEYFKEELKDSKIEEMKSNDGHTSMAVAFKWNGFKDVMKKLMDKEFWLNAPEDCGVVSEVQAEGLAENMERKYQDVKNNGGIPSGP
jgi:hypothetical protein